MLNINLIEHLLEENDSGIVDEKKVQKIIKENLKKTESKKKIKRKFLKELTDKIGAMIFISPSDNPGITDHSSTRIPRRQLIPSEFEEKMIIDYIKNKKVKITKGEYKKIYKEICSMLINAPLNAIAIQLNVSTRREGKKFIEIFYHIKNKESVSYASFKYIEVKGVEHYRSLKTS